MTTTSDWIERFSEREQQEIHFSQIYAKQFAHGTDGHNAKLIIAKMAGILGEYEEQLRQHADERPTPSQ